MVLPAKFVARFAPLHKNPLAIKALWAGVKPTTRRTYSTASRSFEAFCAYLSRASWLVSFELLCSWLVGRAISRYNGIIRQHMKIQPTTTSAYLSALRSVHVDSKLSTTDFDDDHMKRFMAGI
ncbi:hypothetical protein E4U56_005600 [Claviceps arundinis]|uniref:Uncharacterized protein n=1 Tax=Claviceps arundinis TaxID=1623583 RepID=A0A9P7SSC3_9HYPO|nr:hypothetical protein E4U56_005600 [Claviceps arundinis]